MSRDQYLKEVESQFSIMRDRLRSVSTGNSNGMYVFGPPDPMERVRAWTEWNEKAQRSSATNAGSPRTTGQLS